MSINEYSMYLLKSVFNSTSIHWFEPWNIHWYINILTINICRIDISPLSWLNIWIRGTFPGFHGVVVQIWGVKYILIYQYIAYQHIDYQYMPYLYILPSLEWLYETEAGFRVSMWWFSRFELRTRILPLCAILGHSTLHLALLHHVLTTLGPFTLRLAL